MPDAYTYITKPSDNTYVRVNTAGREQYDQTSLTYDSSLTFYDGTDEGAYTFVGKPEAYSLGPELVLNGGFNGNANNWNLDPTWTYSNNAVTCSGSGEISQSNVVTLPVLTQYEVTYTISNSNGGNLQIILAFVSIHNGPQYNGTYKYTGFAENSQAVLFRSLGFKGNLDNVSVKQVLGGLYTSVNKPTT